MNRCDLVILGCLYDRDQHGYDIKSFVEKEELNRWANISVSTIYHRLGWLCSHGFIDNVETSESRPQRTVYTLTDAGKELLNSEVKSFITGFSDDPRTLGLGYLHVLPKELAVTLLQDHITHLEDEVKRLKRMIRQKKKVVSLNPISPLMNNMSLEHIRVEIKYMKAAHEVMSDPEKAKQVDHYFALNL